MNEFTKEELKLIWSSLHATGEQVKFVRDECHIVMDKIKRMIETYDEPEYCVHSGIKLEKKND